MRAEAPDFLSKNSQLAEEVRWTFTDLDEMERELKKAAKAIDCARDLASAYRNRLQQLFDSMVPKKIPACALPAFASPPARRGARRSGPRQSYSELPR
jgi:hypothetical protein